MLFQTTYINKLLVKYVMHNCKKSLLPFKHRAPLSQDQCPKTFEKKYHMKKLPYASMVGNLIYEMLCTIPKFALLQEW